MLNIPVETFYSMQQDYLSNCSYSSTSSTRSTSSSSSTSYVSDKGNTCTDGEDNGKLGFFQVAGNFLEGIGKTAVSMVKTAISHPLQTAGMVGLCCIPVIGPIVGGCLATKGLVSGVTTIASSAIAYANATTDAEAKDILENMGGATLTTGLSAVGLKGSAGMLKAQLSGASTTVNAVRNLGQDATAGDIAQTIVKEGTMETATNVVKLVKAEVNAGKKAIDKVSEYKDAITGKSGTTLSQQVTNDVSKLTEAAGTKAKNAVDKVENKIKEFKNSRSTSSSNTALTKTQIDTLKSNAKSNGSTVTETSNGGFEIKSTSGNTQTTTTYSSKGIETGKTTITQNADGTTVTVKTNYNSNGQVTSNSTTTSSYDSATQEATSTTTSQAYNSKGQMTNTTNETTNLDAITQETTTTTTSRSLKYKDNTVTSEIQETTVETSNSSSPYKLNGTSTSGSSTSTKGNITTSTEINVNEYGYGDTTTTVYNESSGIGKIITEHSDSTMSGVEITTDYFTTNTADGSSIFLDNLTASQRACYNIEVGSLQSILDAELPVLGSITNPFTMGASMVTNLEEEER